jgi:Mg2+-importing ATPase
VPILVIGAAVSLLLTGAQVAAMRDEALWHLSPRATLFVELDPQQKERIVRTLQRTGHSVGYLRTSAPRSPALRMSQERAPTWSC